MIVLRTFSTIASSIIHQVQLEDLDRKINTRLESLMNPMLCPIRVIKAMQYSLKGLLAVWRREASFRQECLLVGVAICAATALNVSVTKKILLISSVILILIVEVINSAIETIVDRISRADHPLSAQAKDMGSAAVLLTILLALFVWMSILWKG